MKHNWKIAIKLAENLGTSPQHGQTYTLQVAKEIIPYINDALDKYQADVNRAGEIDYVALEYDTTEEDHK